MFKDVDRNVRATGDQKASIDITFGFEKVAGSEYDVSRWVVTDGAMCRQLNQVITGKWTFAKQ